MLRKMVSLGLAFVLAAGVLAGCGAKDKKDEKDNATGAAVTVESQVLFEQDGVKATLTGIKMDRTGTDLLISVQNHTDVNVLVHPYDIYVNGYLIADYMSRVVAEATETSSAAIMLMRLSMERNGIKEIGTIEMCLEVSNDVTGEVLFTTDVITAKTSAAAKAQPTPDLKSTIYDKDGIKIGFVGFLETETQALFYVENNSDKKIRLQESGVLLNGEALYAVWSCNLLPGKRTVQPILFLEDISEAMETVDVMFVITDAESWEQIGSTGAVQVTK